MPKATLTEKGSCVQTIWLDSVDSTQTFLLSALKEERYKPPVMVVARKQSLGKGSRGNVWASMEGNLFFSFALTKAMLPSDLPLSAASIYFSFLLKECLALWGSKAWVKWPNDFYLEEKKIGGTITTMYEEMLICGIGLNTHKAPKEFSILDVEVSHEELLKQYQKTLFNSPQWKMVLKKFEIEFDLSKRYTSHMQNSKVSLENATLCEDGSLMVDGQRMYSLR